MLTPRKPAPVGVRAKVKRSPMFSICEVVLDCLSGIGLPLEFDISSTLAGLPPTPVASGVLSVCRFHFASLAGRSVRSRKSHGFQLWFELHRLYSWYLFFRVRIKPCAYTQKAPAFGGWSWGSYLASPTFVLAQMLQSIIHGLRAN